MRTFAKELERAQIWRA